MVSGNSSRQFDVNLSNKAPIRGCRWLIWSFAATGIRLKLEVLHEDADFETVARFVPQFQQRRISAGPA